MSRLTPEIVALAIVAAARHRGFDPILAMTPGPADGRGRVRQLAGAALVSRGHAVAVVAARAVSVNKVQLSPSQLVRSQITAEAVATVAEALPEPAGGPVGPDRRTAPDYVDPRRDEAKEAAVIEDRLNGLGPSRIARKRGCGLSFIHKVIDAARASGTVFPILRPGPEQVLIGEPAPAKAAPRPRPAVTPKVPAASKPPKTPRPPKERPAPPPPPVPVVAIQPFPDDHETWAPLAGSKPVRLIDHEKGCRWPLTIPGAAAPMVCNQPLHGATPYCEPHAWLGASPAIRSTMVRPVHRPATPRVARALSAEDLQDA